MPTQGYTGQIHMVGPLPEPGKMKLKSLPEWHIYTEVFSRFRK